MAEFNNNIKVGNIYSPVEGGKKMKVTSVEDPSMLGSGEVQVVLVRDRNGYCYAYHCNGIPLEKGDSGYGLQHSVLKDSPR